MYIDGEIQYPTLIISDVDLSVQRDFGDCKEHPMEMQQVISISRSIPHTIETRSKGAEVLLNLGILHFKI